MNCCSDSVPPSMNYGCDNSMFYDQTKSIWLQLEGKVERKAIKLLARQYEIESISQEAPEYREQIEVRQMPIILTYFDPINPRKKFEWVLKTAKIQW